MKNEIQRETVLSNFKNECRMKFKERQYWIYMFFQKPEIKMSQFFLNEWKMKYKERQYTDICTILLKINEKWNSKWGRTLSDR